MKDSLEEWFSRKLLAGNNNNQRAAFKVAALKSLDASSETIKISECFLTEQL